MIKILLIPLILGYKLLNYTYINPIQNIYLVNESYRPILTDALSVLNIPNSKYKFNIGLSLNSIIFKPGYLGYTDFILLNNTIKYFNIYINPINLSYITLYNVILHELSHIHLLGHSDDKNSISGFVVYKNLQNNIIQSNHLLKLTYDDCLGIIKQKKYCIKYK